MPDILKAQINILKEQVERIDSFIKSIEDFNTEKHDDFRRGSISALRITKEDIEKQIKEMEGIYDEAV